MAGNYAYLRWLSVRSDTIGFLARTVRDTGGVRLLGALVAYLDRVCRTNRRLVRREAC